jgi:outer membrane murein-binding lipoprotein Lpp
MRTSLKTAAAAAALAAIALAGCSSGSHPDEAACKAAMTSNYAYALEHPDAPQATEPAACKGLSKATLERLVAEIMTGNTVPPSPAVTP